MAKAPPFVSAVMRWFTMVSALITAALNGAVLLLAVKFQIAAPNPIAHLQATVESSILRTCIHNVENMVK